jgi:hypothetical protein
MCNVVVNTGIHHSSSGLFVPSRTNMKFTTFQEGVNESCFHAIFKPSCQAAILPCAHASQGGSGQSSPSQGTASLCHWNRCSKSHCCTSHQLSRMSENVVISRVVFSSCFNNENLWTCAMACENGHGPSSLADGTTHFSQWSCCSNSHHCQMRRSRREAPFQSCVNWRKTTGGGCWIEYSVACPSPLMVDMMMTSLAHRTVMHVFRHDRVAPNATNVDFATLQMTKSCTCFRCDCVMDMAFVDIKSVQYGVSFRRGSFIHHNHIGFPLSKMCRIKLVATFKFRIIF